MGAPGPGRHDQPQQTQQLADSVAKLAAAADQLAKGVERLGGQGVLSAVDTATGKVTALSTSIGTGLLPRLAKASVGLQSMFAQIASGFGVANNQLVQLAAAANPAGAVQLNMAYRSLTYTLGQILQPVLQGATRLLRFLADTLYNLSPGTKALIVAVAAFTVTLAAMVPVLATVVTLFGVIDVELAGIPILIGALVAAFAAVAVGAGTLVAAGGKFSTIVDALAPLKDLAGDLIDLFDELISAGMDAFADALRAVAPAVRVFAQTLREVMRELQPLLRTLAPMVAALGAAGLLAILTALVTPLVLVAGYLTGLVHTFEALGRVIGLASDEAQRFLEIAARLSTVSGGVSGVVGGNLAINQLKAGQAGREKGSAPFGPVDVRATTAEEFQRSLTRSALTASFGQGAQAGPEEETAENTRTAAEVLQEIRDTLAEKLGGVGDYLRRVGGRA
jgi:methyl-accepting chemotaxis protein